jgi:hypothetical protein
MHTFKNVSLDTIGNWLNHFLGNSDTNSLLLSPDALMKRAGDNGCKVTVAPIDNFEFGIMEWGVEEFKSITWDSDGSFDQNSTFFFISDETIRNKEGFELSLNKLEQFADYFEDIFNMEFFQPSDYIICMKAEMQIRIVHHEGVRIVIERS